MIKKVLCVILLTLGFNFFLSGKSYGKIYFNAIGSLVNAGDAKLQTGFGGELGTDITPDIDFYFRHINSIKTDNVGESTETKYRHFMYMGVVQYKYNFRVQPVSITGSFGLGWSKTDINYDENNREDLTDSGINYSFSVGGQYYLTQSVSPFLRLGYHSSLYYGDLDSKSIGGYEIQLGVSFTIYGKNKELSEMY